MASSGTYNFNPAADELLIDAFARIQIKRAALTVDHLRDAARQSNLLMAEWANKQPLLWRSESQSIPLIDGTASYSPTARTIAILTAFIRTGSGSTQIDRTLGALSTTEYASMPNKNLEGPPTSFWFDRQITPAITLYPVPDATSTYTLILRTVSQVQDVAITNGTTLDVPYRFLDAFTAGLAHRLARLYAPSLEALRKADAMEAWQIASSNDVENVPVYLTPSVRAYYQ